jgi:3,4-dihydroxy 2-butanone 4-phosphate synthase/GTP cyclohydrolase II
LRDYGIGAQILRDVGVRKMRLISNTSRHISGLKGFGLEVAERVPLLVEEPDLNLHVEPSCSLKLLLHDAGATDSGSSL